MKIRATTTSQVGVPEDVTTIHNTELDQEHAGGCPVSLLDVDRREVVQEDRVTLRGQDLVLVSNSTFVGSSLPSPGLHTVRARAWIGCISWGIRLRTSSQRNNHTEAITCTNQSSTKL